MLAANGCARALLYEQPGQFNETSPDSEMKRRFLLAVGCTDTCVFQRVTSQARCARPRLRGVGVSHRGLVANSNPPIKKQRDQCGVTLLHCDSEWTVSSAVNRISICPFLKQKACQVNITLLDSEMKRRLPLAVGRTDTITSQARCVPFDEVHRANALQAMTVGVTLFYRYSEWTIS